MKYLEFIIDNYRGIKGPLTIDIKKNTLLPLIGVNESGKTTVLHAVFAFDYYNDDLNNGRHLQDTMNLFAVSPLPPTVSAHIQISLSEFKANLRDLQKKARARAKEGLSEKETSSAGTATTLDMDELHSYEDLEETFPPYLRIQRDLKSLRYDILSDGFPHKALNHLLSEEIISGLPFTLFFDDFRDSVDDRIEIKKAADGTMSSWLSIMEQLFHQTDPSFSVFDLENKEERLRKTMLAKVMTKLNSTLTKEWQNFRIDDGDALKLHLSFEVETLADGTKSKFLKLDVIETDVAGDEYYFYIRDRSKGFFWFFNFVMKLEFNPKVVTGSENDTIYLLDEPGSYLHSSAQSKLCSKLRSLSEKNTVIYCTHSHYLLNPDIIPLSSIYVADKNRNGNIELIPVHAYKGRSTTARSAFQPVIDALQIKPFQLDFNYKNTVIVEGIFDYYAFEMFKGERDINFLPSVNAQSMQYYISIMIAWRVEYYALWDNDEIGRREYGKAKGSFGDEEANRRFSLLPLKGKNARKRILQDLFSGEDLKMIRQELGVSLSSSFDKTIATLYFAPNRDKILTRISVETRNNFDEVFEHLRKSRGK